MKLKLFTTIVLLATIVFGQVGIGTDTPHSSAILELSSSNKALLLPRLAGTAQVTNPTDGMLIYDVSTECVKFYENNAWSDCVSSPAPAPSVSSLACLAAYVPQVGGSPSNHPTQGIYNRGTKEITYTGGNGVSYNALTISSTGPTGLTATLSPGTLQNGSGSFTLTIEGTPAGDGSALFELNFGGQQCVFTQTID